MINKRKVAIEYEERIIKIFIFKSCSRFQVICYGRYSIWGYMRGAEKELIPDRSAFKVITRSAFTKYFTLCPASHISFLIAAAWLLSQHFKFVFSSISLLVPIFVLVRIGFHTAEAIYPVNLSDFNTIKVISCAHQVW